MSLSEGRNRRNVIRIPNIKFPDLKRLYSLIVKAGKVVSSIYFTQWFVPYWATTHSWQIGVRVGDTGTFGMGTVGLVIYLVVIAGIFNIKE